MPEGCNNAAKVWKSAAAGAIGGLVAAFAMNQFQAVLKTVSESVARKERERQGQPEPAPKPESEGDDATVNAAQTISGIVFDHDLTDDEKKWAGPAVHYALGTSLGAVYGALASSTEKVEAGAGTGYGAAVWLGADETAVPLLGFSPPPSETPISGHVSALASHLVFGLVTHFTRKLLLR